MGTSSTHFRRALKDATSPVKVNREERLMILIISSNHTVCTLNPPLPQRKVHNTHQDTNRSGFQLWKTLMVSFSCTRQKRVNKRNKKGLLFKPQPKSVRGERKPKPHLVLLFYHQATTFTEQIHKIFPSLVSAHTVLLTHLSPTNMFSWAFNWLLWTCLTHWV